MPTQISDLWQPSIWVPALREKQAKFPSLFNSGIVVNTPLFDTIASGAGVAANIPFFKDITDQGDEIQVENTAPATDNVQTSGQQVAPILNRQCKNSATALSAQVAGDDPVSAILDAMTERRLKQRQTTFISMLRGMFGTGSQALNAAAPLSGARLGGTTAEPFSETGASPAADKKMSPEIFINAKALLGELSGDLRNGCFLVHPNIYAALEILDKDGFKTGKPSDLPFEITTYRQVPIFQSEALVRAGTTSGFVYDSYIIAKGVVARGEKPQVGDQVDVASLQMDTDKDKNNEVVYDRTRFVLHLNGMKWVGTPAGQSATNAELGTVANWNLVYSSASRCGAVAVRTNG